MTIEAFKVEDLGVDHEQYFPGVGTAFTEYDIVQVGVGSTLAEAYDDAIEALGAGGYDVDAIDAADAVFTKEQLEAPLHDPTDECQADSEDCPHYHYAAIYVKGEAD